MDYRVPFPDDLARAAAGEPPHPRGWRGASEGTVKWWKDAKGYGAVAVPELAPWDVWCHWSMIEREGRRALVPGDRVHVTYYRGQQESFRYVGESLRVLDPAPGPRAGVGDAGDAG